MTQRGRGTSAAAAYYSAPLVRRSATRAPRGRRPRAVARARPISRALSAAGSRSTRRSSRSPPGSRRVAGLIREVVASSYFGTTGPASAFTLAFQVPNLVRSLFADAALSAAFVPVFTELLESDRRREAFNLAGALFGLILAVLGVITVIFMALAGVIIPLFTGPEYTAELDSLAVGLSRVLFPIVVLLGLNGLLVGILNAYDHFTIPALAPLVWNLVIIAWMVGLPRLLRGPGRAVRLRDRRARGHRRAVRDGAARRCDGSAST